MRLLLVRCLFVLLLLVVAMLLLLPCKWGLRQVLPCSARGCGVVGCAGVVLVLLRLPLPAGQDYSCSSSGCWAEPAPVARRAIGVQGPGTTACWRPMRGWRRGRGPRLAAAPGVCVHQQCPLLLLQLVAVPAAPIQLQQPHAQLHSLYVGSRAGGNAGLSCRALALPLCGSAAAVHAAAWGRRRWQGGGMQR